MAVNQVGTITATTELVVRKEKWVLLSPPNQILIEIDFFQRSCVFRSETRWMLLLALALMCRKLSINSFWHSSEWLGYNELWRQQHSFYHKVIDSTLLLTETFPRKDDEFGMDLSEKISFEKRSHNQYKTSFIIFIYLQHTKEEFPLLSKLKSILWKWWNETT